MKNLYVNAVYCLISYLFFSTPLAANSIDSLPNYSINQASNSFYLDDELKEISGLSLSNDGKKLIAVQDETGVLYFLNKKTGKIIEKITFWKEGDYEGVECVGKTIYAVKNTGTIYEIMLDKSNKSSLTKHKGFLTETNDVEGLGYDANKKMLLLACKGEAGIREVAPKQRAVYGFDLKNKQFLPKPLYTVHLDSLQKKMNSSPSEEVKFAPSGIAIHPLSKEVYLLSSVGKLLVVLSPSGRLLHIAKLEKTIHAQPEGIAFDEKGTLFIANEGKNGKPIVHCFTYKKKGK